MQFWSAPLLMRATTFVEKSLTTKMIIEYHFCNVTWEIVWRNCSWETSFSGMSVIFCKLLGIWEQLGICVSWMKSFVRSSRSVTLRLVISYLRSQTWASSSLTSSWMSFVVSCWKGFGIGYFWKSFSRLGVPISSMMTFVSSLRTKSLSLLRYSFFVSSSEIFPIRSIRNTFWFLFARTLIILIGEDSYSDSSSSELW